MFELHPNMIHPWLLGVYVCVGTGRGRSVGGGRDRFARLLVMDKSLT